MVARAKKADLHLYAACSTKPRCYPAVKVALDKHATIRQLDLTGFARQLGELVQLITSPMC